MNERLSERERIIEEIKHEIRMSTTTSGQFLGGNFAESIADFIITDRKRIVAPLVNYGDTHDTFKRDWPLVQNAINETLKNAGIE